MRVSQLTVKNGKVLYTRDLSLRNDFVMGQNTSAFGLRLLCETHEDFQTEIAEFPTSPQ